MKIKNRIEYRHIDDQKKWSITTFTPLIDFKYDMELSSGEVVQAAALRLLTSGNVENHLCLSTQAGCKFSCNFCTSGRAGFKRNMTKDEIINQIILIKDDLKIEKFDHVVFMGIGEPLDNLPALVSGIESIISNDEYYKNRIDIATVGLPDKIIELSKYHLPISLWISLHAAIDGKRKILMPIAEKYSVRDVINAAAVYANETRSLVWLNYMLFSGFNDQNDDLQMLKNILSGKKDVFGIIVTQPNSKVMDKYYPATIEEIEIFYQKLSNMVDNRIVKFITTGAEIKAGCGEFVFFGG